jgi:hydrogenase-4 component F
MMDLLAPNWLPIVLLLTPLITAPLAWRMPPHWAERVHVLGLTALLAIGWTLAVRVFVGGPLSLGGVFFADALSALLVAMVCLVGWAAGVYGIGYLHRDIAAGDLQASAPRYFALWYHLFLATMLTVLVVENLGLMWVALEGTTLASALLVGFYRTERAVEAAWKYLILCTVGLVLALFGLFIMYYAGVHALGSEDAALSWPALTAAAASLEPALVKLAFVFILVGFGTKAGFAPLHTWLPDAHSQAPTPVSAVLSGVLLPCALYAILRFHAIAVGAVGPEFSSHLLIGFGVLSAAVATPFILLQHDVKRLLAYSSIEHMGIVAVAVGIGGPIALFAAALHLVGHALGKALLFFAAGNIAGRYGTRTMRRIQGATAVLPLSSTSLLIGGLALGGAPPSALFTSELGILAAAFQRGYGAIGLVLLICMALIFVGLLYHLSRLVLGCAPPELAKGERRGQWALIGTLLLIVGLLGIAVPPPLANVLQQATIAMGLP